MADEKIIKEAMKHSKLRRFVQYDSETQNQDQNINNNHNNNTFEKDLKEKEEINRRFQELRKKHSNLGVDLEAEEYIQHLRDLGEYNRWSLKLVQKWLTIFYNGN